MDPKQLTVEIVRPTLTALGLYSLAAERLIVGTIWQESRGEFVRQLGGGPALGLIQMEPATFHDIWENYLLYKADLASKVVKFSTLGQLNKEFLPAEWDLIGNIPFAVAMCRVHYLRVRERLPDANDLDGLARYWKQYYNTPLGKGTAEEFVENFPREILSI